METVTQVWVVPAAGGKAMQYTRGDKSSTARSVTDGSMLAFVGSRKGWRAVRLWMMRLMAAKRG